MVFGFWVLVCDFGFWFWFWLRFFGLFFSFDFGDFGFWLVFALDFQFGFAFDSGSVWVLVWFGLVGLVLIG